MLFECLVYLWDSSISSKKRVDGNFLLAEQLVSYNCYVSKVGDILFCETRMSTKLALTYKQKANRTITVRNLGQQSHLIRQAHQWKGHLLRLKILVNCTYKSLF